jgi:hypothetical protein
MIEQIKWGKPQLILPGYEIDMEEEFFSKNPRKEISI